MSSFLGRWTCRCSVWHKYMVCVCAACVQEEEERVEELLVPMGYEDAPPVVMITTTTRGEDEEEERGEEGEGDDQEEEGEHVVRHFIKVRNDAAWPVSITAVRDRSKGGRRRGREIPDRVKGPGTRRVPARQ